MDFLSIQWDNSSQSEGNATLLWNNTTPVIELTLKHTTLPTWFLVVNLFVRAIEGVLALLGNSLTIAAVTRFEVLRTTSNLLVCQLAVADILSGLSPIWMVCQYALRWNFAAWHVFCVIEQTLGMLSSFLNVSIIAAIAVERCIYISYPLRYVSLITTRVVVGTIVGLWVFCVTEITTFLLLGTGMKEGMDCRSTTVFNSPAFKMNTQVSFFIITIIIVVMYSRIAWIAYHQAKRVEEVCMFLLHMCDNKLIELEREARGYDIY